MPALYHDLPQELTELLYTFDGHRLLGKLALVRHKPNAPRSEDIQYVDEPDDLEYLSIYFANAITKLGKKLGFRQRTIATATVFFRRFYLKNSYCETDPFTVIAACCYVAAKAEESPVHIKLIVTESRSLFSQQLYSSSKTFPIDNSKVAEMEFYLVDDLECDLVVFHPYRTLLSLCKKEPSGEGSEEGEAEDVGVGIGIDDGPRYWGTGDGQLEMTSAAFQTAWSIINDTYRSQLCVLYPPHLIAIAAIYLTFILHPPEVAQITKQEPVQQAPTQPPAPRRSSRQAKEQPVVPPQAKPQDPISFLAGLNVSLPLIASISQEILSLYTLWDSYKEDSSPDLPKSSREPTESPSPMKRSLSVQGTPAAEESPEADDGRITTAYLSSVLQQMREAHFMDISPIVPPRPVVVNKRLERTQAAG